MLKKITKWETEDGKVFDTQEEAEEYMFEQEIAVMTCATDWKSFDAWYEENIGDENKPVREAAFSAWQAAPGDAVQAAVPNGRWIERWHGSGGKEGLEGWSILDAESRALVAHLGRNVDSETVTAIVMAHNALAEGVPEQEADTKRASQGWKLVPVPQSIEQMAVDRYKVVPSHESMFHRWAVVAGNGTQQLYIGREAECQNMARKFTGAFLDGAFVALAAAPRPAAAALSPSIAVTPEMVEAANEAYCPFGDMELALCAALQVAPIPPGAAPVKEE